MVLLLVPLLRVIWSINVGECSKQRPPKPRNSVRQPSVAFAICAGSEAINTRKREGGGRLPRGSKPGDLLPAESRRIGSYDD